MAKQVTQTLKLEYNYQPDLVGGGLEDASRVLLLAYLSRDLGHAFCLRKPGENHVFELEMPVSQGKPFIEADAALTIRAFAAGVNDDGLACMRQVGSCFFNIAELLTPVKKATAPRHLVVPNLETADSVPQKGTIQLVVHPLPDMENAVLPVTEHDYLPQNYNKFIEVLMQFQQLARLPHVELKPTFPNAFGLCMPMWRSAHMIAPGCTFATPRAEPASEQWHYNALLAAARRAFPNLESNAEAEALLMSSSITESQIVNICMLSHCAVVANGTCYVGDGVYVKRGSLLKVKSDMHAAGIGALLSASHVKTEFCHRSIDQEKRANLALIGLRVPDDVEFCGMEDFAVGLMRFMKDAKWKALGAADCEDGGADITFQAWDLMSGQFKQPLLKRVQNVLAHYDTAQTLDYVNGRELADSLRQNRLGGHCKAAYLSTDYEIQLQEAGSTARPVFSTLTRRVGRVPDDYKANPVITGEGTGLMMPLADTKLAEQMQRNHEYLELFKDSGNAMRGVRWMMPHSKDKASRFYNTVMSISPKRIAEDYGAIEHILTKSTARGQTIGIDYNEFLNGSASNSAWIAGRFTDEQIPYIQRLLKHHAPIPAYQAAPDVQTPQPLLDRLVQHASQQKRMCTTQQPEYYQVYFRENSVEPAAVQILMSAVTSKKRVYRVSYHHENFGQDLGSWCVQFYLNP